MTAPNPDLSDLLEITVDPEAAPVDVDDAVADFLIAFVTKNADQSQAEHREAD